MKNQGFTLIELIIYAGIICIVLVGACTFAWQIIQGNIKTGALREVSQNASFAMEKITGAVQAASEIDTPRPGKIKSELELRMLDPDLDPTIFEVDDNILLMKQGVIGPYKLTTDLVKVTNLKFTNLSYENTPGTLRIEMTVEHVNPAGRSEYEASLDLKNSVSLRF